VQSIAVIADTQSGWMQT